MARWTCRYLKLPRYCVGVDGYDECGERSREVVCAYPHYMLEMEESSWTGLCTKNGDLGSLFQLVRKISVPRSDTVMSLALGATLSRARSSQARVDGRVRTKHGGGRLAVAGGPAHTAVFVVPGNNSCLPRIVSETCPSWISLRYEQLPRWSPRLPSPWQSDGRARCSLGSCV